MYCFLSLVTLDSHIAMLVISLTSFGSWQIFILNNILWFLSFPLPFLIFQQWENIVVKNLVLSSKRLFLWWCCAMTCLYQGLLGIKPLPTEIWKCLHQWKIGLQWRLPCKKKNGPTTWERVALWSAYQNTERFSGYISNQGQHEEDLERQISMNIKKFDL